MIEIIRNDNDDIIAVCEWLLFDDDAKLDDKGRIVCVCELEINKAYRGNGMIRKIINNIEKKCPTAEVMFFKREKKYPEKGYRIYKREQIVKRMED